MVAWLVPIALFPVLASLYFAAPARSVEGVGTGRQLLGLLLHFAAYLVAFAVARAVLSPMAGEVGGVALASVVAVILLQPLGNLSFRALGVRLHKAA